jgi:hypothetical protein
MLCRYGESFPSLAAQILHRDRHKKRNFREETITDLLMAGLTAFEPFVFVDFPTNESKTGDDMIWEFVAPNAKDHRRYLRLHIQAKRAISGAPKRDSYWWYRELDHESAKGAGYGSQAQRLISSCKTGAGAVPLYAFYHTLEALDPPQVGGVNLMFAHHLLPLLRARPPAKGNSRWPSSDRKIERWRPHFMSLTDVLCSCGGPIAINPPPEGMALLVGPVSDRFSPGRLADRLNELWSSQALGDESDFDAIEAVADIPSETTRAIEAHRSGERIEVERPRAIFCSDGTDAFPFPWPG